MFTVIDIMNKFIVFSSPIDTIAAILIEFGSCFLLTTGHEVLQLDEKDLQSKLSLLFKKNLYDIAVRIAKNNQYDSESLAEIFKQYGDHLYSKGDFGGLHFSYGNFYILFKYIFLCLGAVDQYGKTIGFLEPSYVIRRFLDSRHINYLTDYLQGLHKQGHATADHTTLLLNCFTRLDRTEQLTEFLRNDHNPDIMFDLDVAIKVCRNASVEHALSLARRNQKHDACLSILTEDQCAYVEAVNYIQQLPFIDAEQMMRKYGCILIQQCKDETTELLKKLCTNFRPHYDRIVHQQLFNNDEDYFSQPDRANAEDFILYFAKDPDRLIDFLQYLVATLVSVSPMVYNTLIELYLQRWQEDEKMRHKLMDILQNSVIEYDRNHVLVMCRMYEFWPGILLIYEEQKL